MLSMVARGGEGEPRDLPQFTRGSIATVIENMWSCDNASIKDRRPIEIPQKGIAE
jgi:hypothetical protein